MTKVLHQMQQLPLHRPNRLQATAAPAPADDRQEILARQPRDTVGQQRSVVTDAMGVTSRRDLLAWTFAPNEAASGIAANRVQFSRDLVATDRLLMTFLKLPRVLAAPLAGAILCVDGYLKLSFLNVQVLPKNHFLMSRYGHDVVGDDLPAGLKRPDLLKVLPAELFDRIVAMAASTSPGENSVRYFGQPCAGQGNQFWGKVGINPKKNCQLSLLGRRWNEILRQNQFWDPYVGSWKEDPLPGSDNLKKQYVRAMGQKSAKYQWLVRSLYGGIIFNAEQMMAHFGSRDMGRLLALAAVQTDARAWGWLPGSMPQDKKYLELALSAEQGWTIADSVQDKLRPDEKCILDLLRRSQAVHRWNMMSDGEKNSLEALGAAMGEDEAIRRIYFLASDSLRNRNDFNEKFVEIYPLGLRFMGRQKASRKETLEAAEKSWPMARAFAACVPERLPQGY